MTTERQAQLRAATDAALGIVHRDGIWWYDAPGPPPAPPLLGLDIRPRRRALCLWSDPPTRVPLLDGTQQQAQGAVGVLTGGRHGPSVLHMNTTQTAGQALTAELRRYFQVGARTRSHRNGADVKRDMLQAIEYAITFPGYYAERTEQALRPASGALRSWQKHVEGYRIDGVLAYQLRSLTPYQFAAYLGRMVDAGITNVGEGERFFQAEARTARVAA